MSTLVQDNPARRRFEILVDGGLVGFTSYRLHNDTVVFLHTEVDPQFQEMGIGSSLVRGALDQVRARGGRVVARCPFVASFIRRHPVYGDLLADRSPAD